MFMAIIIFLILGFQDCLPLNPRHLAGMEPVLAFNTAISFITNTDWQAYGGETTLSNFSQMTAITFPMFTSATTGFVVAMAFIRAFTIRDGSTGLGNFYRDLIRFTTRVLLPVSFVLALVMVQQGEPQTLAPDVVAHTSSGRRHRPSRSDPVASIETIKHLGTNGGGFFNANAAHPFENPTPLTNLIQTLADDHSAEFDRNVLWRNDRQPAPGLGALRRDGRDGDHVLADRCCFGAGRHAAVGESWH